MSSYLPLHVDRLQLLGKRDGIASTLHTHLTRNALIISRSGVLGSAGIPGYNPLPIATTLRNASKSLRRHRKLLAAIRPGSVQIFQRKMFTLTFYERLDGSGRRAPRTFVQMEHHASTRDLPMTSIAWRFADTWIGIARLPCIRVVQPEEHWWRPSISLS